MKLHLTITSLTLLLTAVLVASVLWLSGSLRRAPQVASQEDDCFEVVANVAGSLAPAQNDDFLYQQELVNGIEPIEWPREHLAVVQHPRCDAVAFLDTRLKPNDVVFGIVDGEEAIAFPQRVMVWDQLVSVVKNGRRGVLSYSPLTGSAVGYFLLPDMRLESAEQLVNANLVMYDHNAESSIPQIYGAGINGHLKGRHLEEFPVLWTTWERWKNVYPNSRVMVPKNESGSVQWDNDPYGSYEQATGYYQSEELIFTPQRQDNRLPVKQVVVGLRDFEHNAIAIDKNALRSRGLVEVELGGRPVLVIYDRTLDSYEAHYADTGEWVNAFDVMWFAWVAYYPGTQLVQ